MNLWVPETSRLVMPGVYLSDQELKRLVEVGIEACVVLSFTDIVGNHGSMVWICMQNARRCPLKMRTPCGETSVVLSQCEGCCGWCSE